MCKQVIWTSASGWLMLKFLLSSQMHRRVWSNFWIKWLSAFILSIMLVNSLTGTALLLRTTLRERKTRTNPKKIDHAVLRNSNIMKKYSRKSERQPSTIPKNTNFTCQTATHTPRCGWLMKHDLQPVREREQPPLSPPKHPKTKLTWRVMEKIKTTQSEIIFFVCNFSQ